MKKLFARIKPAIPVRGRKAYVVMPPNRRVAVLIRNGGSQVASDGVGLLELAKKVPVPEEFSGAEVRLAIIDISAGCTESMGLSSAEPKHFRWQKL